jgi:hypothetical protein
MIESISLRHVKSINQEYSVVDKTGSGYTNPKNRKNFFLLAGKLYVYKENRKKVIKDVWSSGGFDLRRSQTSVNPMGMSI